MDMKAMIEQIKSALGYPVIDLYIEDPQIERCVNMALLLAKDHLQSRRYKTLDPVRSMGENGLYYNSYADLSELDLELVTQVFRGDLLAPYLFDQFYLVNYATRGVPASLATVINMRSNVEALINRSWKVIGNKLYLDKFYGKVTIEFIPKTISIDDVVDSYWIGWILRYATAQAKEVSARIVGKFEVESNPFKMDTASLLSEASAEKAALMAEIENHGLLDIKR